jgi:tight adherence protein C
MMESLQSLFSSNTQTVFFIVIFSAVFFATLAVAAVIVNRGAVRRRLEPGAEHRGHGAGKSDTPSVVKDAAPTGLDRILNRVHERVGPKDEAETSSVRLKLAQAGYMGANAVGRYFTIRVVLSVGLPLVVVLAAPALTRTAPVQTVLLIGVLAGLIGLYFPHLWVSHRISARQQEAQDGFPDALDLLLVCVEAGLGLNAALHRVGQEIGKAHEVLGTQFDIVGLELRAGMSRELALRNLAERLGIDEVKSLVAILIQSDTLGTSIAQALRAHPCRGYAQETDVAGGRKSP